MDLFFKSEELGACGMRVTFHSIVFSNFIQLDEFMKEFTFQVSCRAYDTADCIPADRTVS